MKNKILITVIFLIGVFFPLTSVSALTKINFSESSNGQINTKLHFDEGFVGAIDIDFKVSGDVYVNNFKFSDKITSGNYSKKYKYNENKHILTVRVTSGGIGTKHNLLNSKKELDLGTISIASSAKEDVSYKLSEVEFKIVDNKWSSKTIDKSNIELKKTEFVYNVVNSNSKPDVGDSKDNNSNNNSNSDNNSNNYTSSKKETSTKNNSTKNKSDSKDTSKDSSTVKEESNNISNSKKDSEDTNKKSSKTDNNVKSNTSKNNDKVSERKFNLAIPIVSVLVVGGGFIFFFKKGIISKKKRLRKNKRN